MTLLKKPRAKLQIEWIDNDLLCELEGRFEIKIEDYRILWIGNKR